jgi:tetratricopeptide (TPR) repeat protein/serine/threonine protein kinase
MAAKIPDVEALFFAARQQPPEKRGAWLDKACGDDAQLRQRVEQFLAAQADIGSFLESPAAAPLLATVDDPLPERPGTVIGPYKLMEQIGEGGMGLVFVAEQTQPIRRKVALKVLKPGMDTRQVVARFEAERQALAIMDHANIARVLDGGATTSGRPYFVMELVKGVPITEFCDQHQVAVRQRLELFLPVCQAVQHAHQKGIIHRDLKPSNVLVMSQDGTPLVKVIDFGIAKAIGQQLTDKTIYTQFAQLIGTPLYMSPEQAGQSGIDVDTRSDIYSLGVLLYELLTGTTPFTIEHFREAGYDEMRRIIREEEPPRPSTRISTLGQAATTITTQRQSDPKRLSRLYRGELDWMVMKCLEKDRNRRYESTAALAADVQRHLVDEPVQARPPSAGYRLRKFVRRNRAGLAVAALVLVFLVVLGAGAGWMVRDQAVRQALARGEVEEAVLEGEMHGDRAQALVGDPHQWAAALSAGHAALQRAKALAAAGELVDPALEARMQALAGRLREGDGDRGLAATLERIHLEQSEPNVKESRFSYSEAAPRYEEAFAASGLTAVSMPPAEAAALLAAKPRVLQAVLVAAFDHWLMACEDRVPQRVWLRAVLTAADSDAWRNQVRAAMLQGDRAALETLAERPEALRQPPATLVLLARSLRRQRANPSAVRLLRRAQERYPEDFWVNHSLAYVLAASRPPQPAEAVAVFRIAVALRPRSAGVYLNFGSALEAAGDLDRAVAAYRKAIDLAPDYAWAHSRLGLALDARHDLDGALAAQRKAVALNPNDGRFYHNLGGVLHDRGDVDGAIATYHKAMQLNPKDHKPHNNLGLLLMERKDLPGAIAALRKAIDLSPTSAMPWVNLGTALKRQGDLPGAFAASRKAVALDPDLPKAHYNLGIDLYASKDLPGAIAAYRRALQLQPDYADAWYNLGIALAEKGDRPGAIAAYRKAVDARPDHHAAHNNLGRDLEDAEDLSGAITHFRKAIAIDPKRDTAHFNLGNVLLKKGDLSGAVAAYQQAAALNPESARTHSNLGAALLAQGDLTAALAAYRKALALEPKSAEAHSNLGYALAAAGDLPRAVAAYRRALALEPRYAVAHNNLGVALRRQNRLAGAEAACRTALDIDPNFAEAHNNLGLVRKLQGDLAAALACYRKAIALKPNYLDALLNLGSGLSQQGAYAKASGPLIKAKELAPDNVYPWFYQAMASLGAREPGTYRRECTGMLARFGKSKNGAVVSFMLYASVTRPDGMADPAGLVPLAEAASPLVSLGQIRGALLYRAGKNEAAVRHFERAAQDGPLRAWDCFFLAMAHQRLGQADQARRWFYRGVRWVDRANRQQAEEKRSLWIAWFEQVAVEHLRQEAEAMMKGKPSAGPAPKEKEPPPGKP